MVAGDNLFSEPLTDFVKAARESAATLATYDVGDLEAIKKQAVVLTDAEENDSIAIRPMTIVGLSWDHRALDGVQAAQFLATVKRNLEGLAAG